MTYLSIERVAIYSVEKIKLQKKKINIKKRE